MQALQIERQNSILSKANDEEGTHSTMSPGMKAA